MYTYIHIYIYIYTYVYIIKVSESWERQASKEFDRQRSTASQADYYNT